MPFIDKMSCGRLGRVVVPLSSEQRLIVAISSKGTHNLTLGSLIKTNVCCSSSVRYTMSLFSSKIAFCFFWWTLIPHFGCPEYEVSWEHPVLLLTFIYPHGTLLGPKTHTH